jgi:hypothetical protein
MDGLIGHRDGLGQRALNRLTARNRIAAGIVAIAIVTEHSIVLQAMPDPLGRDLHQTILRLSVHRARCILMLVNIDCGHSQFQQTKGCSAAENASGASSAEDQCCRRSRQQSSQSVIFAARRINTRSGSNVIPAWP